VKKHNIVDMLLIISGFIILVFIILTFRSEGSHYTVQGAIECIPITLFGSTLFISGYIGYKIDRKK